MRPSSILRKSSINEPKMTHSPREYKMRKKRKLSNKVRD